VRTTYPDGAIDYLLYVITVVHCGRPVFLFVPIFHFFFFFFFNIISFFKSDDQRDLRFAFCDLRRPRYRADTDSARRKNYEFDVRKKKNSRIYYRRPRAIVFYENRIRLCL
jgi:ABC-type dipeptide/oligopeptide/nickel transport system permease component